MSNGAIHHHVQLFPSTCSNRLSSSGLVTSFLVFLFSFSILPSIIVLRRESPLIMWPGQFKCWLRIIPISDFFHPLSPKYEEVNEVVVCDRLSNL